MVLDQMLAWAVASRRYWAVEAPEHTAAVVAVSGRDSVAERTVAAAAAAVVQAGTAVEQPRVESTAVAAVAVARPVQALAQVLQLWQNLRSRRQADHRPAQGDQVSRSRRQARVDHWALMGSRSRTQALWLGR